MGYISFTEFSHEAYEIKDNEEVNTNVIKRVGLGLGKIWVRLRVRGRLQSALWIELASVMNPSKGRVALSSIK